MPCLTTREELSAVDFVIRYEELTTDFAILLSILNARQPRVAGAPDLKGVLSWQQKLEGNAPDTGGAFTVYLHCYCALLPLARV